MRTSDSFVCNCGFGRGELTEHLATCAIYAPSAATVREKEQADARALWAVRVLDALGRQLTAKHGRYVSGTTPCVIQTGGGFSGHWLGCGNQHIGCTEDAARLAAALTVYPELPADARAELGECP